MKRVAMTALLLLALTSVSAQQPTTGNRQPTTAPAPAPAAPAQAPSEEPGKYVGANPATSAPASVPTCPIFALTTYWPDGRPNTR